MKLFFLYIPIKSGKDKIGIRSVNSAIIIIFTYFTTIYIIYQIKHIMIFYFANRLQILKPFATIPKVIKLKKYFMAIILSIMIFILTGCNNNLYRGKSIIATHYVAYDIAKRIVGNKISVGLLTKPGSDPHTFTYTSDMINSALKAKLLITNAKFSDYQIMELDDYIKKDKKEKLNLFYELYKNNHKINEDEILNHIKDKKTNKKDEHENEEEDKKIHKYAHFYNSYDNISQMMKIILKKIQKLDPKNSGYYSENLQKIQNKMVNLWNDSLYIRNYSIDRKQIFFLGHDSFGLFEKEFDIKMITLNNHISSDKINKSTEFNNFIKQLNEKKPTHIFTPELSENEHLKESIRESLTYKDFDFYELHSLHNISSEDFKKDVSVYDIFKRNLEVIKNYILNLK